MRPVNPNKPDVVNKSHGGATEKVPIDPTFYLGPPAAWHAQPNGEFENIHDTTVFVVTNQNVASGW